jgi:hypothetical protein
MPYPRATLVLLIAFWPLTALVLFADSVALAGHSLGGQWITNLLAPLFLLGLMRPLPPDRQLVAALFVPIAAAGETVFSLVFGLYTYRLGGVPPYVPFGHAILLGIGLLLADLPFVLRHARPIRVALIAFHGGLIGGAGLLGDSLSVLFGLVFFLVLWRKRGQLLYLIIGVLVLYIELLGTAWGCWTWGPAPWGVLHTLNPPVGAFACYVLADILALKSAAWVAPRLARLRAAPPLPE